METKETAKAIRAKLQQQHFAPRDISVVCQLYSLGSSIHVVIKNPNVSLRSVSEIVSPFERVRYDEITGEILGGGNMYISCRYSSDAGAARAAQFADEVNAAIAQLPPEESGICIPIGTTDFSLCRSREYVGEVFQLWKDNGEGSDFCGNSYNPEGVCYRLAELT